MCASMEIFRLIAELRTVRTMSIHSGMPKSLACNYLRRFGPRLEFSTAYPMRKVAAFGPFPSTIAASNAHGGKLWETQPCLAARCFQPPGGQSTVRNSAMNRETQSSELRDLAFSPHCDRNSEMLMIRSGLGPGWWRSHCGPTVFRRPRSDAGSWVSSIRSASVPRPSSLRDTCPRWPAAWVENARLA